MTKAKQKKGKSLKGSGVKARQFNPGAEAYKHWLAIPPEFRADDEAKTITEYAKKHKVDRGTLYNWTQKPGFWKEVRELYEKQYAYKNLRVDQSLYQRAVGHPCGSISEESGTRDGKFVSIKKKTTTHNAPDINAIELWKTIHDGYVRKLEMKQTSVLDVMKATLEEEKNQEKGG